jgi:hypothetical protein
LNGGGEGYPARINGEQPMGIEVGGIFGLILLVLNIWAIVHIVQSAATTGEKVIWIVVIILLPLIGFIIWFFVGPRHRRV